MPLESGIRIGPYDVVGALGAGGMGEVYRARDARLKRDVALKILPPTVADDPDRLARFEREAQALAALNHPNIAAIYGFEEKAGDGGTPVRALVLELVEGETLAERIVRGSLATADALAIAKQIAAALEAAHEQGIVHRDLKPANIKITPDGVVKVLDFGLAKLASGDHSGTDRMQTLAASMSPTMTTPALATGAGVLLGTAAYMSPEQARGKVADKRADIWSFGVVLYEMLTGLRAFAGDTVTETAGAVIHKDLEWAALPADLPASIRTVLRRCLQKDPLQRVRDMGDVRLALDGAFAPDTPAAPATASAGSRRRWIELAAAAIVAAAVTAAVVWPLTRPAPPPDRFAIRTSAPLNTSILALSPDGRYLAGIVGSPETGPRIWIHAFETGTSRPLEQAGLVRQPPFWSPDGRSIGFVSGNQLKRIDIAGGPPQVICDVLASSFAGATWTRENVILFSEASSGGIKEVPASGGTPVQRTKATNGTDVLPWVLPDGRHFLYTRIAANNGPSHMLVGSLGTPPDKQDTRTLLTTSQGVAYAPAPDGGPGHLLFMRDRLLLAQSFDPQSLTLSGEPAPVAEQVGSVNVLGAFSVSPSGTLTYWRVASDTGSLVWVGRDGSTTPIASGLKSVRNPRLSPDGRVLVAIVEGDLWAYDIGGRPPIRLTFDGDHYSPVFTRDGSRVVYENSTPRGLFSVPADGRGGTPSQVGPEGHFHAYAWSPDGNQVIAIRMPDQAGKNATPDLVTFAAGSDAAVQGIVETPAAEGAASLSPDGRWLAYSSDSTGTNEVWIRPFPGPGAPVRVSPSGGSEPLWSKSGRELYYLQGANLMAVALEPGPTLNFKPATRVLDATPFERGTQSPNYDVAADGRFVIVKPDAQSNQSVSVILNWQELLRQNTAH